MEPEAAGSGHESAGSGTGNGAGQQEVLQYCDFEDFLRFLGIDAGAEGSELITVAAQWMFASPLPPDWSEQIDEASSRVYFFNKATGESLWSHPREGLFREVIEEVRCWQSGQSLETIVARSDAHLRQAHTSAVESIKQWSAHPVAKGPEEASEFYFNAATGESSWEDPRKDCEFDLRLRHSILCQCLSSHSQSLNRLASSESSDGELEASKTLTIGGAQALVRGLWETLGPLPLPLQSMARPSDLPPLESASGTRSAVVSTGDETVRSSLDYLSARSSTSHLDSARSAD